MISRREFVAGSIACALASKAPTRPAEARSVLVNDVHSQLNSTRVLKVLQPRSLQEVQEIIRTARRNRQAISVAGGRHAMGGQQFGTDTLLIDIRELNRTIHLNREQGMLTVESGIEWPKLIGDYLALQNVDRRQWGLAQKQTG